jgi:hypothetical protein
MRELFRSIDRDLTRAQLRTGERQGRWRHVDLDVWAVGPEDLSRVDRARGAVLATSGISCGTLAAVLLRCDGVDFGCDPFVVTASHTRAGSCRRTIAPGYVIIVDGLRCTSGTRTLLDIAAVVTDDVWEQALESLLRRGRTSIADIEGRLGRGHRGSARVRRVLTRRPAGAAAIESFLETLFVQLARLVPGLPPPVRQYRVVDRHGRFVARVDLCWPELGLFIELDGQHHKHQPVHDARRETAVIAATGWLVGRFTWHEVVHLPRSTARHLEELVAQCRRRPITG